MYVSIDVEFAFNPLPGFCLECLSCNVGHLWSPLPHTCSNMCSCSTCICNTSKQLVEVSLLNYFPLLQAVEAEKQQNYVRKRKKADWSVSCCILSLLLGILLLAVIAMTVSAVEFKVFTARL